jgi:hypothetical protein
MNAGPRLTVNIEIDEVQTETLHASTLNELYSGLETFFQTYHFTDALIRQKIRERIVASFRNAQKSAWGITYADLEPPLETPFSAKENVLTPGMPDKGYSRNQAGEARGLGEAGWTENHKSAAVLPSKSAIKNCYNKNLKAGSILQGYGKVEAGLGKKRSVVNMKSAHFGPKPPSKIGPAWGNKTSRPAIGTAKSKPLARVFPRLQTGHTVSTFTDLHTEADRPEPLKRPQRLPLTPEIGYPKMSIGVRPGASGYALLAENRSTDFNFMPENQLIAHPASTAKPMSYNCMTDRPNRTQTFVPPLVAVANELESGRNWDHMTKSWAFPRIRSQVQRERTHASSAHLRLDDSGVQLQHKPTNSDIAMFDQVNLDYNGAGLGHHLYRRRTQLESPVKYFGEHLPQTQETKDLRMSPRTDHSPVEVLDRSKDDAGFKYFLKIGCKNDRLIQIFRCLDEKRVGQLSATNLNLSSVSSEVLKSFKPVITHIYENPGNNTFDFTEFLRLIYKYEVTF